MHPAVSPRKKKSARPRQSTNRYEIGIAAHPRGASSRRRGRRRNAVARPGAPIIFFSPSTLLHFYFHSASRSGAEARSWWTRKNAAPEHD